MRVIVTKITSYYKHLKTRKCDKYNIWTVWQSMHWLQFSRAWNVL